MASAAARLATAPDETALRVAPSALNRLKKLGFSAGEITEIVAPRRTLDRRRKQGGEGKDPECRGQHGTLLGPVRAVSAHILWVSLAQQTASGGK